VRWHILNRWHHDGKHHSGVMANDQSLADDLIAAGERAMDTAWQLPLDDEYDELLKSNFADMATQN
jgi:leucyl aminopeptidase